METVRLTNAQARRFLLRRHGLIGDPVFEGKAGALAYVRQCGCIQFDPIDVCGKNAELVLQSRCAGFTKAMLDTLLYKDRALVDYFDKNLAIFPVEDWPAFARGRQRNVLEGRSREEVDRAAAAVLEALASRECVCARDLALNEKVSWYWSDSSLGRAVLETLYFRGTLCVHHKQGTIKHYAPAERLLPAGILAAPDPYPTPEAHRDFRVLRRIGAVGLLWNRASDAWLCVPGLRDGGRAEAFASLTARGALTAVEVEGIAQPLYARVEDTPLLAEIASGAEYAPRMELLAPLDCLLWDRRLIEALFGFSYTWEIYTPEAKRRYGYYVLPLLFGEALVGRVEAVADRKARVLRVKGIWWEDRAHKAELRRCLKRFAAFNGCGAVEGL
ncbi:hypothetical protein FACS1894196_0910 [Clostridia bacterium]|nr:hypothetical protein FACS1894196_0910 [Clostridia bacterium]